MASSKDPKNRPTHSDLNASGDSPARVTNESILNDLRAGLRTKGFLTKYGLTMKQFERLIIKLIRDGLWSKEEFKAWKAHKLGPAPEPEQNQDQGSFERTYEAEDLENELVDELDEPPARPKRFQAPETYIIEHPQVNDSLAMKLFSTKRSEMPGGRFKVHLHGKKLAFTVEKMLYRGPVDLLQGVVPKKKDLKKKREQALEYVSKHGWASYLESRAFTATFGADAPEVRTSARLVLLQCKNKTFVAAIHTPAPAVNLYVDGRLDAIRTRLAKVVDLEALSI
jgi:hypothetical protein